MTNELTKYHYKIHFPAIKAVVLLKVVILFIFSPYSLADENLISVVLSRNGYVSYATISPLHFEATRKGQDTYRTTSGASLAQQMELTIYSTCNRKYPNEPLKFPTLNRQILNVLLLLRPHSNDPKPAYYLTFTGIGRMFKQLLLRGGKPSFNEKGTLTLQSVENATWNIAITRTDVTATSDTSYTIEFTNPIEQKTFIQTLTSTTLNYSENKSAKATLLLKSPSIEVKAVYSLIHPGTENYKKLESVNIVDWWTKQLDWCPLLDQDNKDINNVGVIIQ